MIDGATPDAQTVATGSLGRGTARPATAFVSPIIACGALMARKRGTVLRAGPIGLRLVLDDGSTHDIRGAPSNFAQLTGSRVWFTEGPDGLVREYGVF